MGLYNAKASRYSTTPRSSERDRGAIIPQSLKAWREPFIFYLHGANKLPRHQGFGPRGGPKRLARHSARNQKQPPSVCTMQKPPDTAQPPGHPNVTGGLLLILDFYQIGLPLAFYSVIRSRIPDSGRDISAQSPLKHQLHIRFRLLQYFARGCRVLSHICECCLELA